MAETDRANRNRLPGHAAAVQPRLLWRRQRRRRQPVQRVAEPARRQACSGRVGRRPSLQALAWPRGSWLAGGHGRPLFPSLAVSALLHRLLLPPPHPPPHTPRTARVNRSPSTRPLRRLGPDSSAGLLFTVPPLTMVWKVPRGSASVSFSLAFGFERGEIRFSFFFFIFSFCYLFRSGLSPQTGVFVSAVRFFSFLPQVLLQSMIGGFFFILSERCLLVWCVMLGLVHLTLSCRVVSSCSVRCGYGCGCAGVRLCCVCEAIQGLVDRWRGELRNLCVFVTDDCT